MPENFSNSVSVLTDASGGEDDDRRRKGPPPLPMALASIMLIGFMFNVVAVGFSHLIRGSIGSGSLLTLVGLLLIGCAIGVYRRNRIAWFGAVVTLCALSVLLVVGAIVMGTLGALLWVVFFVIPLLLLMLPGSRDALVRSSAPS